MKSYFEFIYRGYNSICEIDIPQELIDNGVNNAISHNEEMFEKYGGYNHLFAEYKKIYKKDAIKEQTILPKEYEKILLEKDIKKRITEQNHKSIKEPEPEIEYKLVKIQSLSNIWNMYEIYYIFCNLQFTPSIILGCDKTEEEVKERVLWQISFYNKNFCDTKPSK